MKKKGFAQDLGRRFAVVYKKYSHRETSFSRWLREKGVKSTVAVWVVRALNSIVVGVLLYVAFWGTLFFVGCLGISAFLRSKGSDEDPVVGFQSDKLFPDHHSPKNSHDSKFN
ncbi:hypothetical protein BFW86_14565 [Pseudomonas fluorescens]|nr:hypothetical protein BFW86_14565 [Pseudomonas fluorescens]